MWQSSPPSPYPAALRPGAPAQSSHSLCQHVSPLSDSLQTVRQELIPRPWKGSPSCKVRTPGQRGEQRPAVGSQEHGRPASLPCFWRFVFWRVFLCSTSHSLCFREWLCWIYWLYLEFIFSKDTAANAYTFILSWDAKRSETDKKWKQFKTQEGMEQDSAQHLSSKSELPMKGTALWHK